MAPATPEDLLVLVVGQILNNGGTINYKWMNKVDDRFTAKALQHRFDPIRKKANEMISKAGEVSPPVQTPTPTKRKAPATPVTASRKKTAEEMAQADTGEGNDEAATPTSTKKRKVSTATKIKEEDKS